MTAARPAVPRPAADPGKAVAVAAGAEGAVGAAGAALDSPGEMLARCAEGGLVAPAARTDIMNRLKRAEGQLRGIQRMVAHGEDCLKVAQQFSAVRRALDSTYVRMTVSLLEQEIGSRLATGTPAAAGLPEIISELEAMLSRRG